jgi:hypothetical protein
MNTPMHKHWQKLTRGLTLACAALAITACGAADDSELFAGSDSDDADITQIGQTEESLMNCANPDGTNSVMAALAVAAAQELKRWQPSRDFVVFGTSGRSESSPGSQQAIRLTPTGKSRCSDGRCTTVQALLDLQYDQANNAVRIGNQIVNPGALRSRLVAKLREQATCEQRAGAVGSNCPVEEHTLSFLRSQPGGCDTNFFFKATGVNGQPLKQPALLKNKLIWVDVQNPYIAFQNLGDTVSIDPTLGLNEDAQATSGACQASCVKITRSDVSGQCCSCLGATRRFSRSPWNAATFLCK